MGVIFHMLDITSIIFIKNKLSLKANTSQFSHFKTIIFDNIIKINMA